MAWHVYECSKNSMHVHEFLEAPAASELAGKKCGMTGCKGVLTLSAAVTTATPIFKKGVGGFHAPTRD